jgi:anti-sigma B factor antagonist
MKISEQAHGGPAILDLKGDPLGEDDALQLKQKVYSLIQDGVRHVILNLKDVRHINSAGLGGLVCVMTALRKVGGDVFLAQTGANVSRILSITQLNKIFESYNTVEDAVGRLKG